MSTMEKGTNMTTYRKLLNALVLGAALAATGPLAGANAQTAGEGSVLERFVGDEPTAFATPDEAVAAFKTAIAADDVAALATLLGLDAEALAKADGLKERIGEIRDDAAELLTVKGEGDVRIVSVGNEVWPFPFPVTKLDDGTWAFATYAGLEEIVNRRVGENELQAIATARAFVEAQRDYAALDHDGDGVLEYAQLLVSSPGLADGLYWPADEVNGESPAGASINEAALDKANAGGGYFGYRFKILPGQGENIAGGKYDYVINGNMIGGFALVAWPVTYAETGVNTFVVNQAGIVYEKDFAADTEKTASEMTVFNPDDSWTVVED